MKRKRIILAIVLSLCLCAGVIGFSACNDMQPPKISTRPGGSPETETPSTPETGNTGVKLTADMTEEELFFAIGSAESLTITLKSGVISSNSSNFVKTNGEQIYQFTNKQSYVWQSNSHYMYINFCQLSGDCFYEYEYESGSESVITKSLKKYGNSNEIKIKSIAASVLEMIEKSADGWKITNKEISDKNIQNYEVIFNDGNLLINFDYNDNLNEKSKYEIKLSGICTIISKPEDFKDLKESDAVWDTIVDFNNVTYYLNNVSNTYAVYDVNPTSITGILIEKSINNLPVGEIMYSAFANCVNLSAIVIPESIKIIENNAFENCTSLTTITIPIGVETLGYDVFKGCTNLTTINCAAGSKPAGWDENWLGVLSEDIVHWGV